MGFLEALGRSNALPDTMKAITDTAMTIRKDQRAQQEAEDQNALKLKELAIEQDKANAYKAYMDVNRQRTQQQIADEQRKQAELDKPVAVVPLLRLAGYSEDMASQLAQRYQQAGYADTDPNTGQIVSTRRKFDLFQQDMSKMDSNALSIAHDVSKIHYEAVTNDINKLEAALDNPKTKPEQLPQIRQQLAMKVKEQSNILASMDAEAKALKGTLLADQAQQAKNKTEALNLLMKNFVTLDQDPEQYAQNPVLLQARNMLAKKAGLPEAKLVPYKSWGIMHYKLVPATSTEPATKKAVSKAPASRKAVPKAKGGKVTVDSVVKAINSLE